MEARRILVYGVTGSGKSTLAREIAARAGLPYIPVDDLTWNSDWVPVAEDRQRELIAEVCAGEAWVLDGAYAIWLEPVLSRVELIVGLDYRRAVSLSRLIRRCTGNLLLRRTLCNGNRERVRNLLSRDSIVRWHFHSFASKRRRMRAWALEPGRPRVLLHGSPRETRRWINAELPSRS